MFETAYRIDLLPLFESDLQEALDYIAGELQNPTAAENLLLRVKAAIQERALSPLGYEPYSKSHGVKLEHYRIYVGNYTVFYRVEGAVMLVERFLYSARNLPRFLS